MNLASSPVTASAPARTAVVTRSRRSTWWLGLVGLVVVGVLGYLPYLVYSNITNLLVNVGILITMASMWNLLAGYAGLVSVGQQAFVGLGSYLVLICAQQGMNPFVALPLAVAGTAVAGLPVWWLVSRLRTAYFSIATWVIASVFYLIIIRFPSLGSGTGVSLPGLGGLDPTLLTAYTYWITLVVTVLVLATVYLMLRSRLGLELTAIRDDEVAARSSGVRVGRAQRLVFVVAAAGCGAAGGLVIISQLNVEPTAAFSVSWSAQMIFATVIGGIGSIEGPIIGAIIFFALEQTLQNYGAWYFIVLGLVAITIAIWARRGLWGLVAERLNIRIFPVGYYLWPSTSTPGRRLLRVAGRRGAGPGASAGAVPVPTPAPPAEPLSAVPPPAPPAAPPPLAGDQGDGAGGAAPIP